MVLYIFIIHAEEDRFSLASSLAKGLADETIKVIYQNYSLPPPVTEAEPAIERLTSSLSEGLTECSQCIILVSSGFLSIPWKAGDLDRFLNSQDPGRVLVVCLGVSPEEVNRVSHIMRDEAIFGRIDELDVVLGKLREVILDKQWEEYPEFWRIGFDLRILDVFGCCECESHPRLDLSYPRPAPEGTSGLLVCPLCGLGYWIRNGVSQLLGDSAIYPDEPQRSFAKAVRRADETI